MTGLRVGKLPSPLLARLLSRYPAPGPDVLLGPAVGEDAAVVSAGGRALVAAVDPVTFAVEDIGWYAVTINANDVATRGAAPRWFLSTVLLPEGCRPELAESVFRQTQQACRELGIAWIGGHTEVTAGLPRPIVSGAMLGLADRSTLVRTAGARPGDSLLLTKAIAVEATALLAREKSAELRRRFPPAFLQRCRSRLRELSVVREALLAVRYGGVHAMHDPTEGGLSTGLWELAEAAGVSVEVDADRLPVLDECEALCRHFGLDPMGLLASGSLLICARPQSARRIIPALSRAGIPCREIGRVTKGSGVRLASGSRSKSLPRFERDELTKVL